MKGNTAESTKHEKNRASPLGLRNNKLEKSRKLSPETFITAGTIIAIFLLWFVISKLHLVNATFFPSPAQTWSAFQDILLNGYKGESLLYHLYNSLFRLFAAFFLAVITAVPLGLMSGYSSKIRAALDPIIEFYRPLPPLSYYTLLILWFGIENTSKIALLYLAAFAPIYLAAMSAVKGVSIDRLHSGESLGANKWQVFRYIIFPSCLPEIFTGMRTALGFAYTTLVAAEMVAAVSGIGWMVLDASKYLRSDIMFVGIIIMGITGILLDRLFRMIESKLIPWRGKD
ncbi:ABC transporter permease [Ferviditalea candida]|uniref:ABC transporter permease subunit n=1 Tax=Ferviditalea candida TaxID=3108399 RepID=A0ABU5ZEP6_9BACL|nr:ABC transporter permease subunit [Paenibacillaceae bacterium T2]